MANGMNVSICLNDLLSGGQVAQAPDGSMWLNLGSLPEIFQRSEKNGKTYVTAFIDMYDELNQYNQCGKMTLPKTNAQKAANAYGTIIGNLKYNQQQQQAPAGQPGAVAAMPWGQAPAANTAPPATTPGPWGQPASQPAAPQTNQWQPAATGNGLPF